MKDLGFKVYVPKESSVETLGTVAQYAGEGGQVKFTGNNNIVGKKKEDGSLTRVTIAILRADGTSVAINCSASLSATVRNALKWDAAKQKYVNKGKVLTGILPLNIVEQKETGIRSISVPVGEGGAEEAFAVSDLLKETVSYAELVAF